MNTRLLDKNGDWQWGVRLSNSSACVAQSIQTRLKLWQGEWFLDLTDGTPYIQDIMGLGTNYDLEIQARILGTPGVQSIISYSSSISSSRVLSVNAIVQTIYGPTAIVIS